jgi:hypothetical protein
VNEEMITMKKKTVVSLFVLALVAFGAWSITGCTEEEIIEIALATEFPAEFVQNSTSEQWDTFKIIDLAAEVEKALEGTDYSREDLTKAVLNGASYEVTDWTPPVGDHDDWVVGGKVTVQRTDGNPGPVTEVFTYSGVSVKNSVHVKTVADLNPAGVGVINAALESFVDDPTSEPVLQFVTSNESVVPSPSVQDPIIFDWTVWVRYQLLVPKIFDKFDPLP